ncbi:hypothetical protein [Methylibium rhizosphaerae]|uniref:hypothetical protein n=1 Tax=Methylibium rhizosphaerae TaxID=2570323 RepID=UPI0015E2863C|nr:hypothetical protein [Methylibium rhizosphaerae]
MFRSLLLTGLGLAATALHAREPVPVMNFEDIPVAGSSGRQLGAEEVRQAIEAAGAAKSWQMTLRAPGMLEATYWKAEKHVVSVVIAYDATKYSVRYLRSVNMNYAQASRADFDPKVRDGREAAPPQRDIEVQRQREAFAGRPESVYARPAPIGVIHPAYEQWVRQLIVGVQGQLALARTADR